MQHTSVFVPALILLPLSRQTRGTFLYIIPEEKREKKGRCGRQRVCRKKRRQNREIWGGGDSKSSKKERKRDNRELWNIYRGLETDVKK